MPREARESTHKRRADLLPFSWLGLCELPGRERGLCIVDTLGDEVTRYLVIARGLSADEIEPAWRDAYSAIIWGRGAPTTYLLEESERLAIPEASILGAWGYALEKAELRDESDTRRRVWALVALRTEGRKVTRHEVLPESDPDFIVATDAYERLTFRNLLCDWRAA